MVKAVDHGITSATATTAWESTKKGVEGGFLGTLAGALIGAATTVAASLLTLPGWAAIGAGAALGAVIAVAAPVVTIGTGIAYGAMATLGLIGAIGAVAGGVTGGTAGTLGGSVFGLFKGAGRVAKEKAAYVERGDDHQVANAARMQYAAQAGAQQGFMAGRAQGQQEGAAIMAERVREMQMAQLAEKIGPVPQKSHTAAIQAERAAAAANSGKQVG